MSSTSLRENTPLVHGSAPTCKTSAAPSGSHSSSLRSVAPHGVISVPLFSGADLSGSSAGSHLRGTATMILPLTISTGYESTPLPGFSLRRPVVTSYFQPWARHVTMLPSSLPCASDEPWCRHVSLIAQIFPSTLKSATPVSPTYTNRLRPGATCSSCATSTKSGMRDLLGSCRLFVFDFAGQRMPVRTDRLTRRQLSVRRIEHRARLTLLPVRRQTEVEQSFFDAVVPDPDLQELVRFLGACDLAAELPRHSDVLLHHLHRRQVFTLLRVPKIVLDARSGVLTERDREGRERPAEPEHRLVGPLRAVRCAPDQLHPVERIRSCGSAARQAEETVQGARVDPKADQALHLLELMHGREREVRLDPAFPQALQVLDVELGCRVGDHVGVLPPDHRIAHV